jgi:protocatechuate 3,4-dioxygenase beta subunit
MKRRDMLKAMAGAGLFLVGCTKDDSGDSAVGGECETVPQEGAGPFPGDGSNGPNVLSTDGVVRKDIRSSFGDMSGRAEGVPLTIRLNILDDAQCAAYAGAAVYLWQCDREGRYSLYNQGVTNQNYLRGVQAAGDDGVVEFTSIFPGAYGNRWPHIHFAVYPSLDAATSGKSEVATSQLALPEDVCRIVYAADGYEQSVRNLGSTPLARDTVFRDGVDKQMATVTGSAGAGYVATLTVPV